MNIKNIVISGIVLALLSTQVLKGAEVTDVTARQRYPWNGLVDIGCTLSGNAGTTYQLIVSAVDKVGGTNLTVKTVNIEGSPEVGNPVSATPGTHRLVWNADADLPKGYRSSRVSIRVKAVEMARKYMVVNLSNGVIEYTDTVPSDGWDQTVYKTTYMVFQRVEAGTYRQRYQGSGRNVTITKPFYLSLSHLRLGQYETLGFGSSTWVKQVDPVQFRGDGCFMVLRGKYDENDKGDWPSKGHVVADSSIIGILRARTGKDNFDLPTAGMLGKAAQSMSLSTKGSVCLDWHSYYLGESDVVDPVGPPSVESGAGRVCVSSSGEPVSYLVTQSTAYGSVYICYYDAE